MSLLDEARGQLEAGVAAYIRAAQQPYQPVLPPAAETLTALGASHARKGVSTQQQEQQQQRTTTATAGTITKTVKAATATAAAAATTPTPPTLKTNGSHGSSSSSNPKQARAKLLELVKKFQRATFVTAQVSKDEVTAGDGGGSVSRRGTRMEGMSRQQSVVAAIAASTAPNGPSSLNATALPALAASVSGSRPGSKKGAGDGRLGQTPAAAAAVAAPLDATSPGLKRADMRDASLHPLPSHAGSVVSATHRSQSNNTRRYQDTERSLSVATSAAGRERSASPSSAAAAHSATALRRLEASLAFTRDCLRYAETFADAGLTQEAQTCFLQLVAPDVNGWYEPMVTRCVERRTQPGEIAAAAAAAAAKDNAHGSQQQEQNDPASSSATSQAAIRRRSSKGKGARDSRKHNAASLSSLDGSSQPSGTHASAAQRLAEAAAGAVSGEEALVSGLRVTDTLDVFASDVPLPLALQVYKCVLRYRALLLFIKFRELLQTDAYGDAAGMATGLAACACVEDMVALQQRVLHTATFSAAVVLSREEARMREDVSHSSAAKPVQSIVIAGGCKLVDVLAEPAAAKTAEASLAAFLDGPTPLFYAVDEVAAPVLLTMRLYVAKMCEQLAGFVRGATTDVSRGATEEARAAVHQRCLDALRASASMSELHLRHAKPPAAVPQSPDSAKNAAFLYDKTCLPLAAVEYVPWRLQEYALLQQTYLQLEDGSAGAVVAAERALLQVLQLMELEHLDPVPPPATTTVVLDTAVQQCAAWLLVATWRAAIAHGSSSVSAYAGLATATAAGGGGGDGAAVSSAFAASSPQSGPLSPSESMGSAQPSTHGDAAAALGGDGAAGAAGGVPAAVTARCAMAAITAAVQRAVAFLIASPAAGLPATTTDVSARRGSRKSGSTPLSSAAAHKNSSSSSGSSPSAVDGTRLLVVLWTCMAQVQQQCSLVAGRSAAADALAAAASDVAYAEAQESMWATEAAQGTNSTPPPNAAGTVSPAKSPSPARKANAAPKQATAAAPPPPAASDGDASGPVDPSAAAASVTSSSPLSSAHLIRPPAELRHSHPAVLELSRRFPRLALELLGRLVSVVEAAGAVPQALPYNPASRTHAPASQRYGDAAVSGGAAKSNVKAGSEAADRKAAKGGRQRASSVAVSGGNDSLNGSYGGSGGGGVNPAATAFRTRVLHSVYRGCVDGFEALLHAAAVRSERAWTAEEEEETSRLSVRTRATAWSDAVDVLGYCDETETEVSAVDAGDGADASHDRSGGAAQKPQQQQLPSSSPLHSLAAFPAAACFLFNPADTRCLLRWNSWETLFTVAGDPLHELPGPGGAALSFTAKSLADAGLVRAVAVLRTLTFSSTRAVLTVRIGVALEAWWRAQLSPAAKKTAAAAPTSTGAAVSIDCALRCLQLLRAVLLASLLHQTQQRQQQPSLSSSRQASTRAKESPLASLLRAFDAAAAALDVRVPAAVRTTAAQPAPAPEAAGDEATQNAAPSPSLSSVPPALNSADAEAEQYRLLSAQAQTSLLLTLWQRQSTPLLPAPTVALHELCEGDEDRGGDAETSTLPSMALLRVSAALMEKTTAALCPGADAHLTAAQPLQGSSSSGGGAGHSAYTPPAPSCASLMLQPIVADAAAFLLRCSESLRSQWQRQRTRRRLRQSGTAAAAAAAASPATATVTAGSRSSTHGATAAAPLSATALLEETEAREEAHYATIVLCVLSSLWHSGGVGSGAPQLEERAVAAVTRRVSTGFLQLLPTESAGGVRDGSGGGGAGPQCRIAPLPLARLIAHGSSVRRLLELTRTHLQHHVESLLRHAAPVTAATNPRGHHHGHHRVPHSHVAVTAAQLQCQRRLLVTARDGLTELTQLWVTVRWQLARLHVHRSDYAARHVDLETLQQRHDQQQVYGRPSAKELRILHTLEHDAPVLPNTAREEEVRLRRWVKDQQNAAIGSPLAPSLQLLEALVCAALVPLNATDPAAQQKLVDEAIRALTEAEKSAATTTSAAAAVVVPAGTAVVTTDGLGGGSSTTEAMHRPGSSRVGGGGGASRGTHAQLPALRHTTATAEPPFLFTPVLLWCYLAEACSGCGTAAQTAQVRGVLDRQLLMESPALVEVDMGSAAAVVTMTAPFTQQLFLHPRWAVLEDCSATTRVAFCRALSALATDDRAGPSSSSSSSALGSLQNSYRLLLALQIQQLPEPAVTAAGVPSSSVQSPSVTDKKKLEATSAAHHHGGGDGGGSPPTAAAVSTSLLTLSAAQHLLASITLYLSRSAGGSAAPRGGSPSAAVLLPLLVELCTVLLRLPASSPQWGDGEMQLLALRVLTLFKQQQLAVLAASPSPLTTQSAAAAVAGTSATAAAAASTVLMDSFLQLLWATFAHVWNSVFRNPTVRQRRYLHETTSATQWARQVLQQHRRRGAGAGGADGDAGSGDGGGNPPSRQGRGNAANAAGATSDGTSPDSAAARSSTSADGSADPLVFPGMAYLPPSDSASPSESSGSTAANVASSPAAHGAGDGTDGDAAEKRGAVAATTAGASTVLLHASMPSEYMELLEDILLHLPALWPLILSPPSSITIPAVSAALSRAGGGSGRPASPQPHATEKESGVASMHTPYDFVVYAALQAVKTLREVPRSAVDAAALSGGERRLSTGAHSTAGGQLKGLSPIYLDVVAALQQYATAMIVAAAAAPTANGGTATNNNNNSSSSAQQGGSGAAAGGRAGGNARSQAASLAAPAVSAACMTLMDALQAHADDPAYAKLAAHVVREMLALCNDDYVSANLSGPATPPGAAAGAGASTGKGKKTPAAAAATTSAAAAAAAGAEGSMGGYRGSVGAVSAAAVTTDVRHVIQSVREHVQKNQRAMRAFLVQVDVETQAWLTRGGFNLAGQMQQQQQQQQQDQQQQQLDGTTAEAGGAAGKAKAAAAAAAPKKAAKKPGKKGAAGGKGNRADAADEGEGDEKEDGDGANGTGAGHSGSSSAAYSTVTRVFTFTEEQKLKQLTCGIAHWRRSRVGRLLRQRYVQYNTAYVAQLHVVEAALLHMGERFRRLAWRQESLVHELLALTEASPEGHEGTGSGAAAAAAAARAGASGGSRGSPRDKKKAMTTASTPAATALSSASTNTSTDKVVAGGSGEELTGELSAHVTEELLHHCVRASNLFQYVWLPSRASAVVQLAVTHLRFAPLPGPAEVPLGLPASQQQQQQSSSSSRQSTSAWLLTQLLMVPLFSLSAVLQGYYDAGRDVHASLLQPTTVKAGAAVALARSAEFVRTVPSLFTLASPAGQQSEEATAELARRQVAQQHRYELLRQRWCVEAEAATRAEATRDEVQDRVRILQQAQQLLPASMESTALKERMVSAADLLSLMSAPRKRAGQLTHTSSKLKQAKATTTAAAASRSVLSREAAHAAAVASASAVSYTPFDGACGAPARRTLAAPDSAVADASRFGQDMAEALLVEQLTSLGGWLERHDRKTAAAAYRAAQQLTAGRHALEVLPCLMRVEEQEEEESDDATTAAAAAAAATQQAYEKARHSVADGVRLLRSARAVRRQWMASSPSTLPQSGQLGMTAVAASTRAEAGRARSVAFGQGSTAMMASDGSALWRAAVEAYETAAQALRSGGLLQLLGECLYELGELHYAAPTGKTRRAATQWSDALDCFLSTPHVFDDWHARRSVPPPSSTRRGLTELVWMTAALTALADKAFAGDVDRATDAQLLCALLVHQHWRLPAVVAGPGADNSTRSPLSSASQPLPAPLYAQLDVTTIAAALRSSGSSEGKAKGSAPPESLPRVVRALLHSAHLLVQREYSAEASVLGAFADYLATVQLQQVELAVEARLVRATAAASLGSFGVAMRHLHSVCVGWGLPQPLASAVGVEYLPGYYSIAAAAARLAPMPASSSAAGAGGGGAAAGAGKKPAAGGATTAAAATTTNTNATSGSPGAAASPSASVGAAAGGGAAAAASLAGAATTVLPASVASLFFFYRDSESPSSPHNTAAIRAFLLACLPGWTADVTAAATTTAGGGADPLPLTRGLLNSAALEQRYGVLLLRKLCLTVAEVLVLLGTSDPAYLLASPPASLHAAAASPPSPGADEATAHSSAAAPPATSTSGGNSGRRRSSASGAPRVGSAGASAAAAGAPLFSAPGLPALVAGARPTNACTEACRFALLLLRSLRHADVRFALVGQPSTASSSGAGGGGSNDGDGSSDSPAASAESAVWLDSLGAVRQWAVLLTGGVYAAQGRFEACLQLLSAAVAEYQDSVPVSQDTAAGDSRDVAGVWSAPRGHAVTPASPSSLSGYGLHGARSGHGSGAALPLNFTCVHWMRVWQLLCRCYSQLRQYAQLESAAGVQGRRVCEACGEASTQRHVFALYHVYALTQMGRVAEATAAMAALQPVAARLVQSDASGHSREAWGLTDDGSVAAAVQWWQRERHSTTSEASTGTLNGAATLAVYERIVAHQTRVAVLEKAVLPWAVGPTIVLDSPNARAVLPLCATAGFAKTREVWRLHHSMAHYAFQLQRHAPPAGAVTHDAKTAVASSGYSRTPQPPSCVKGSSGGARTQAPAAAPSSQGNTLNDVMAGYSPSTRVLCEAQEALCPQYAAQAHPAAWLLSQLLVVRLRARAVCAMLSVRQHREGGGEDDGDSSNDEDGLLGGGHGSRGTATVEFAVRINAPTPQPPPATAADLSSRPAPLLDCPSATLEALPTPVRQVCEELLELLRRCVELPVQQHAMVRILALDLAAVVAAYIRAVRARRTRPRAARPGTGAAVQPALLVPQLEAVVAGCTLLAGLVTDMERRVRTGAESLRGYQTDPRLNPEDAGEALAQQLQAQWPELLCTAVQQTHENVGQLSSTSPLLSGGTRAGATAAAITHPFYDLTSLQQQQQQQLLTAAGGAAEGADAKSSSTSKAKGPAAAAAASSASPFTPTGTATAAPMPMYAAATASPLISVPTLALTFAALTDEAAALDVLAPVSDALEHDAAVQLLTSHLQALSPPLNCTYLCYRDDMRQQLLEAVAGAMGQQHQQLQQQQLLNRPNQRRISAATSKKAGAGGGSGTATGAGANVGSGGGAAGPAAVLALSETDVWKALLPPVLLSAVPPSLFTSVGPDSLGAPLYNSVAAAAVAVPLLEAGDTPAFAAKSSTAGATMWQLFLSVSPLHDARRTEAPSLPGLLSPQSSASLAAEVAALLPPAPLVAALNEANSATDAAGGAAAVGAAGASSASAAFAVAAGGAGGGAAAASARGRGPAKPSGPAAAAAQRNSNGQDYAGSGGGAAAHAGDRNAAGCVWPPPLLAAATAAAAACLVPSTNWPLLDQIQRDTAQVLSAKAPPTNAPSSSVAAKAASSTSTAAPAFPATGASTAAMRSQAGGKGGRTANTASTSALSTSASLLSASGPEGAKAAAAAEAGPVPLRWTGVSLQLSDATMQSLRRHLSAVLQGMHQARGDADGDEDTAAAAVSPGAAAAAADVAGPAALEAEAAQSPAPHNALAAAVSRAQLTLRTHLAAAGVAAAGFGATNTVSSSSMASGAASSAFAAGPGTSGGAGGGGGGAGGGSGGAAAGGAQNSAAGGLASTLRKPGPRVGNAANAGTSTNTAGRRISGGYGDVSGSAAGTGGGAAGLSRATGGLHDDLAEEARVRQTAERSRQRLQHAEELEELKAGLLRELLEAIVAASATAAAAAAMDEARVEHDVRRLLPRCPLTPSVVEFLCEWLGGVSVSGVEAAESTAKAMAPLGSSGHTSLRFYHPGLHEWMQRVAQYVSEQQQQRA